MKIIDDVKHQLRSTVRLSTETYKEVTSPLRLLPNFLIIGAQRCGTTSLYYYLLEHPQMVPGSAKELHFFDEYYARGMRWYRAQFPTTVQKYYAEHIRKQDFITGEATPAYLLHPHAAERISKVLPDIKLIVLLRNPVDRAYSQHWLMTRVNHETLSFEEAIEREQAIITTEREKILADANRSSQNFRSFSYLTRGIYVEQLQQWMKYYPREQFLVLKSEDMYSNPAETIKQTLEFIGLSSLEIKANKEYKQYRLPQKVGYLNKEYPPKMKPETRQYLLDFFKPYNARLQEFLGRDFGWNE
ncbi:MAG: sulfotransferase domain-containing protein [Ktedonobacteraceae bacterium]